MVLAPILTLTLALAGPAPASKTADPVEVVVDGQAIRRSDVERELVETRGLLAEQLEFIRDYKGLDDRGLAAHQRRAAVQRLIERRLVLAACKREKQWPSSAALREAKRQRTVGRHDLVAGGDTSDARLALQLCTKALLAPAVESPVTDEEARAYFHNHRRRLVVPPKPVGRIWEVPVESPGDPAAWEEAGALLVRAARAQAAGDSPSAASRIRTRPVDDGDPAWGVTLARLRPGETSDPVRNRDSVSLVLRLEDRPERERPWDEVRPEVERGIRQERRGVAWQALLARLRFGARIQRP